MEVKPRRILWPTDFSDLSLKAGTYAKGLAELFGAELHMLHVAHLVSTPELAMPYPHGVAVSLSEEEIVKASDGQLAELVREIFHNETAIVRATRLGDVWPEICRYAADQAIDLVVIATHGRTGLRHVFIGSTAERVVQHAPCPVLTVKSVEREFIFD